MTIEQIRQAKPVENSIHNLIQTLSVKLDSAARYGLYEADAKEDGFDDCAELFARLAREEQAAIQELMRCLGDRVPAGA
jgi:rubrerythrin